MKPSAWAGWGIALDPGSVAMPLQFAGDFLWLAVVFFVLAGGAAVAGYRGVAGISMEVARILIFVFLVLAIVSVVL